MVQRTILAVFGGATVIVGGLCVGGPRLTWWVNPEPDLPLRAGGYLWSAKTQSNGARNPFHESMREVSAIGVAKSYCWESPKPAEFGETGQNRVNVGWKVKV